VRLRNAVLRILGRSKFRQYYMQHQQLAAGAAGGTPGGIQAQGTPPHGQSAARDHSPFGRSSIPETTPFSHPSNMFGLMVSHHGHQAFLRIFVQTVRSHAIALQGHISSNFEELYCSMPSRSDLYS
jgi:hypothetical protein